MPSESTYAKARSAGYFLIGMSVAWTAVIFFSPTITGLLFVHDFRVSSWMWLVLLAPTFALVGVAMVSSSWRTKRVATMRLLLSLTILVAFAFLLWPFAAYVLGSSGVDIQINHAWRPSFLTFSTLLIASMVAYVFWRRRKVRIER